MQIYTASGTVVHFPNSRENSRTSSGSIRISNDQLIMTFYSGPLSGHTFTFHIDSERQFSGNGETFRR